MSPRLPIFYGERGDSKAYLRWEKQLELYFEHYQLHGKEQMKVVVGSLRDRAKMWWCGFMEYQAFYPTWTALKKSMRKKFAPRYEKNKDRPHQPTSQRLEVVQDEFKEMRKTLAGMTTLLADLTSRVKESHLEEEELSTPGSEAETDVPEEVELVEDSLIQESIPTLDVVETKPEASSEVIDNSLAIVPYRWAKHVEDFVFPLPCLVHHMPVHKFELPIFISIPPVEEVQHIDFVFGDRPFYHTPTKAWHSDIFVVQYSFHYNTWSDFLAAIFTECCCILFPRRSSRFVAFLPRPLLKIRGRIFFGERGNGVNLGAYKIKLGMILQDNTRLLQMEHPRGH